MKTPLQEAERKLRIAIKAADKRDETSLRREEERSRARRRAINKERTERIARAEAAFMQIRNELKDAP